MCQSSKSFGIFYDFLYFKKEQPAANPFLARRCDRRQSLGETHGIGLKGKNGLPRRTARYGMTPFDATDGELTKIERSQTDSIR